MERLRIGETWKAQGRCVELPPEVFFPSNGVGVEVARRYCAECPVKAPCLEYALENGIEHGVWGGESERERRRIARVRRGGLKRPKRPGNAVVEPKSQIAESSQLERDAVGVLAVQAAEAEVTIRQTAEASDTL